MLGFSLADANPVSVITEKVGVMLSLYIFLLGVWQVSLFIYLEVCV